jgi:hypothetical protein
LKKYTEDVEHNELSKEISYLYYRAFQEPNSLCYENESVRKKSVNARIKSAGFIRAMCNNLSKEEILDLITLGYK